MSTLTLRTSKGSPLTNVEVDANFTNLLVAIGGTNLAPYTLPTPTGTGSPVLSNSPTFTGTVAGITATMVGLGNVTNTSDASKPVSTAQQTALDLKANVASPTFTGTVSGISKTMVGLANVDNTSDANKPVSTAQQTALDLKANIASPTFTGNVLIGTGASTTRFPNALSIASAVSSGGQAEPHVIGVMGEGKGSVTTSTATGLNSVNTITLGAANAAILVGQGVSGTGIGPNATVTAVSGVNVTLSTNNIAAVSGTITFANYGVGLYGAGYTSGLARSGGVVGEGHVSLTGDGGSAIGVRGYANDTHSGGANIGLFGDASNGSSNYALYMNNGGIYSNSAQTWSLNGNLTFSGAYTVTIPTLSLSNALPVASGGTGSTSTAYCSLTSNVSGTLPIASGGTGATSASAALTALGAYAASNPSGYTTNTGTVTSVGGTSPISSSGGTAPTISISQSSNSSNGYLSSTDWSTFNGKLSTTGGTMTGNLTLDAYTEKVATLATSGTIDLTAGTGTTLSCAAAGTVTFTDGLSSGQSISLLLTNGSSYTINWPSGMRWVTATGDTAPTLSASNTLVFWKINSSLYGALVGKSA